MKNKNNKELKEYEKGLAIASSHHLLSSIANMTKLVAIDPNATPKEFYFTKKSFIFLSVSGDTSATLYLNKESKIKSHEWAFVIATAYIVLAFDMYKSSKISGLLGERAVILFATDYVYNILGLKEVPEAWMGYHKLAQDISFKNESSVLEQLKDKTNLSEHLFNFLNYEENSIRLIKQNIPYNSLNATRTFNEQFAHNLVEQAQRTIALKANRNFSQEELKNRNLPINKAQKWFITHYPLLAALSASFEVKQDLDYCQRYGIEIGAVSAQDKLIVINPNANLSEEGMKFVIAHEILHVALGHMSRRAGRDHLLWNLACDFVINHWLVEMKVGLPPEGVFLDRELADKSADEIYLLLAKDVRLRKKMMTLRSKKAGDKYIEGSGNNNSSKKNKNNCDMLDEDPRYFGDFEDACAKSLLRGFFIHQNIGRGEIPASLEEEIKILNQPVIPWQVELAQWINIRFPLQESKRTYSRPSRRQSSTPDIPRASYVRPEDEKNTRTFGVIMDTSASMDRQLLGKCLGAIVSYASAQEVRSIRLVFCDAQTYDEGYVDIEKLIHKVRVKGRGGTVLQQAVNYLENVKDFPKEAPILILTDGYFESNLKVTRDHAFLVPNKHLVTKQANGAVFEFK